MRLLVHWELFFQFAQGRGPPKAGERQDAARRVVRTSRWRATRGAAEQLKFVLRRLGRCTIWQVGAGSRVAKCRGVASRFVLLGVVLHLGLFWVVVKNEG
jgi:hypothetical protein